MLKEITPLHLRCVIGQCPAVYETKEGKFVIIGKKPSAEILKAVGAEIAEDDLVVVLDRDYLQDLSS